MNIIDIGDEDDKGNFGETRVSRIGGICYKQGKRMGELYFSSLL